MKNILLIIFLVIITFITCKSPEERKRQKEQAAINKLIADEKEFVTQAYIIAQVFVKQKLTSPSSAQFPSSDFSNGPVFLKSVRITSYVDSQNSFGSIIRNNYTIKLKQTGDDWSDNSNWKVEDLKFN